LDVFQFAHGANGSTAALQSKAQLDFDCALCYAARIMPGKDRSPIIQPTPLPSSTTGSTHRGRRGLVHRVRLEHLATELLRVVGVLRIPVDIEKLWQQPPHNLWPPPDDVLVGDDPHQRRWQIARSVAELVGRSAWIAKLQLVGKEPFNEDDINIFARALLMPTPLLAGLSPRQKMPPLAQTIFQVPLIQAEIRLAELGLR
jgi:hypothetical protein